MPGAHLLRKKAIGGLRLLSPVAWIGLLTALTVTAAAQPVADSARPSQEPTPTRSDTGTRPSHRLGSLTEVVRLSDGRPAVGARITATPVDLGVAGRTTRTDSLGRFSFDTLPLGLYDIRIDYSAATGIVQRLLIDNALTTTIQLPPPSVDVWRAGARAVFPLVFILLFLTTLIYSRWFHIARPVHAMMRRQLEAVRTSLEVEADDGSQTGSTAKLDVLRKRVGEIRAEIDSLEKERPRLRDVVFWSPGRENAIWVAVHEIERQLASFLAPPELVETSLHWAAAELRKSDRPVGYGLADLIERSLQAPLPSDAARLASQQKARQTLLGRAIAILHSERDVSFSTLMEWQNKVNWLILTALIIILFLAGAMGNSVLFLAGASGGYLSRLMRALRRTELPLDYGASWTTLFLSPIFGALAGWFGVALIEFLTQPDINLLGSAFGHVDWANPTDPATLSIAFLLGFSERLFDAVMGALETHALGEEKAPTPARPIIPATLAQTAGALTTADRGAPRIAAVELQRRATGAARDALLLKGSGFQAGAKARVNGEEREVEFHSAEAMLLPLGEADLNRIDIAGDFLIVVANPGGAASPPFDYA